MSIKEQFLDERFNTSVIAHPALPFFHTCEAIYLQSILDSGELQPRYCGVYGEELLYLFYGKPAYKSADPANSRFNYMMPVIFVVNNEAVKTIKRAVAFDSGAFNHYTDHYLHKSMKKEEFYLTPEKGTLNKMIDYFFSGNDGHFEGIAKKNLDYDPVHFQLEGYHSILNSDHKTDVDDRKATIEIQVDYSIALNNKNIEAIILPKHLAESPTIKKYITDTVAIPTVPIKNYGVAARNYYVYILEEVRKLLIEKKLLHDH